MKVTAILMTSGITLGGVLIGGPATGTPLASIALHDQANLADTIAEQDELVSVVQPILNISDPNETADPGLLDASAVLGFAGVSIDSASSSVHLAWKGPVPDAVQQDISSAPAHVTVEISAASYSLANLRVAESAVLDASAQLEKLLHVRISSVDAGTTGAGLAVNYAVDGTSSDPGSVAVANSLRPFVHAPILNVERSGDIVTTGTRDADASPWHGGAEIEDGTSGTVALCTNGLPVTRDGNSYMLTAAHCTDRSGSSGTWYSRTGASIGSWSSAGIDRYSDSVRYRVGSTSKYIFNGAWNSGDLIGIHGADSNVVGLDICTSGSLSGVHCYARITSTSYALTTEAGVGITVVEAKTTRAGSAINVGGDSGGPVYAPVTVSGSTEANVTGLIYGSNDAYKVDCPSSASHYNPTDTRCYTEVLYPSIQLTLSNQGATLTTL